MIFFVVIIQFCNVKINRKKLDELKNVMETKFWMKKKYEFILMKLLYN